MYLSTANNMAAWQPGMGGQANWQVPDEDVEDDPNAQPVAAASPNMSQYPTFGGYENVGGFNQFAPLPPPPLPPLPIQKPPHMEFEDCAKLSEDECREAILQFVSENCCYGKGPAKDMKMENFLASVALRYKLETFCERRSTGYQQEPYRGQPIDGPQNGSPPPPWDIPVQADYHFCDYKKQVEVPHTATVQICHGCQGMGFNRCHRCYGRGNTICSSCHGCGHQTCHDSERGTYQEQCSWCYGQGRRTCLTCGGDGRVTCDTCQGHRSLKCYILLTVTFVNHMNDFIMEATDMPDELVRDVSGNVVFEQTMLQVWPIMAYPVAEINQNSVQLVEMHKTAFATERRLNQRQQLIAIPVTEIHYEWKDTKTRYWVYGLDRKVYAPDYPSTCCWGCTIL